MPLYEYQCEACGQRFEVIQKFSDPPAETCTKCGKGPVVRMPSSPAIQFKGTGWYITDYSQKGKSGGETGGGKETSAKSDSSAAKSDTSSSGTKSDAPAATPASTSTDKS